MSCLHQTVFTFTPRRPVRRLLTIVWPGQLLETRVSRLGSFRHESSSIWKDLVGPGSAVVLVRRTSKHQASTILRILDSKSRRNASSRAVFSLATSILLTGCPRAVAEHGVEFERALQTQSET